MGKKSRKKKSKTAPLAAEAEGAGAGAGIGAGGTDWSAAPAIGSAGGLARRKQRCAKCSCLLFRDQATANAAATCPGCKGVFCGKCEQLTFCSCSTGDKCVLPARRCKDCAGGVNHKRPADEEMREKSYKEWTEKQISSGEIYSISMVRCDSLLDCVSKCDSLCCHPCVIYATTGVWKGPPRGNINDDQVDRLSYCRLCKMVYCEGCQAAQARHRMKRCAECCQKYCAGCLESKPNWWHTRKGTGTSVLEEVCSPCYYRSKACTNPNCPNDVETTATKRCGDCRRARYCSRECQLAVYPTHREECDRIQYEREEKAAAKASRELFARSCN